jgi:hypothetical protein
MTSAGKLPARFVADQVRAASRNFVIELIHVFPLP